MAIKSISKINSNTVKVVKDTKKWIEDGKEADTRDLEKKRKQISVYADEDLIQEIKVYCVVNKVKLNSFYEQAIKEYYKKNKN